MKKLLILAMSIMMLILTGCGGDTEEKPADTPNNETETETTAEPTPPAEPTKILVAYFSRVGDNYEVGNISKGNTHIVAEMVAERTGGNLFEIKTAKEYPADYRECTEVAKQEQVENLRPELANFVDDLGNYDVIFLGYPIWWTDFPMAVYTFLEQQDFNGKTIIPFCTSAGEYMTGKENNIPEIAKGSTIREGIGIKGKDCQDNPDAVRQKVNQWLEGLGY